MASILYLDVANVIWIFYNRIDTWTHHVSDTYLHQLTGVLFLNFDQICFSPIFKNLFTWCT